MYSFNPQLAIGQSGETSVLHILQAMGFEAGLNDSEDKETLKWFDIWVKKEGSSYWVEVKRDEMSKDTGNVAVEIGALAHSKSSVLIYILPTKEGWSDMYKMPLQSMLQYATHYPVKKLIGQWKAECAIIPRHEFITLPFVRRFIMKEPLHPWEYRK